jgi:hypothetical protein
LALTSTPSIGPSLLELTMPANAVPAIALAEGFAVWYEKAGTQANVIHTAIDSDDRCKLFRIKLPIDLSKSISAKLSKVIQLRH